jgi:hypothetical protein
MGRLTRRSQLKKTGQCADWASPKRRKAMSPDKRADRHQLQIVGNSEAKLEPLTFQSGYAASRISSILNGRTKQFGWLQAVAAKNYSAFVSYEYPATIGNRQGESRMLGEWHN